MEAVSVVRPTCFNKNQVPRVSMSGIRSNRRQPPCIANDVKAVNLHVSRSSGKKLMKINIKSFLHSEEYGGAEVRLHAFLTSELEGCHGSDSLPRHLAPEKTPTISLD